MGESRETEEISVPCRLFPVFRTAAKKLTKPSVGLTRQSSKSKLNKRGKGTKKSGMQHNVF